MTVSCGHNLVVLLAGMWGHFLWEAITTKEPLFLHLSQQTCLVASVFALQGGTNTWGHFMASVVSSFTCDAALFPQTAS